MGYYHEMGKEGQPHRRPRVHEGDLRKKAEKANQINQQPKPPRHDQVEKHQPPSQGDAK